VCAGYFEDVGHGRTDHHDHDLHDLYLYRVHHDEGAHGHVKVPHQLHTLSEFSSNEHQIGMVIQAYESGCGTVDAVYAKKKKTKIHHFPVPHRFH
jgi:hypothetical protein